MNTATMNTRTLEIDGMKCDACVDKVTGALKEVRNITTKSVKVGSATIAADQSGCDAACTAIGGAGYTAREGARDGARDNSANGARTDGSNTAQRPQTQQNPQHTKPADIDQAGSINVNRAGGTNPTTGSNIPNTGMAPKPAQSST